MCRTDQSGNGAGRWTGPDGTQLSESTAEGFYVNDGDDGVYLLRGSGLPVQGIYTCTATDSSGSMREVLVGIYDTDSGTGG